MLHIGVYDVYAKLIDHRVDFLYALFAGGDLRLEISNVLFRVSGRIRSGGQVIAQFPFQEGPLVDQLEVIEQDSFFLDHPAVWWHGARRDSAYISMVPATRDVEQNPIPFEYRRNHRDVRQVGPAVIGCIDHVDIIRADPSGVVVDDGSHGLAHRTQMYGNVRGICDQITVGIKNRTGKIQPLLDIDRVGRIFQSQPHLLGDRHEEVVKNLQHDRVTLSADSRLAFQWNHPGHDQVAGAVKSGLPTRLHHRGGCLFANDGRSRHFVTGPEQVPVEYARCPVLTRHVSRYAGLRQRLASTLALNHELRAHIVHLANGLNRRGFEHHAFTRHEKPVPLPVSSLKPLMHLSDRTTVDLQ